MMNVMQGLRCASITLSVKNCSLAPPPVELPWMLPGVSRAPLPAEVSTGTFSDAPLEFPSTPHPPNKFLVLIESKRQMVDSNRDFTISNHTNSALNRSTPPTCLAQYDEFNAPDYAALETELSTARSWMSWQPWKKRFSRSALHILGHARSGSDQWTIVQPCTAWSYHRGGAPEFLDGASCVRLRCSGRPFVLGAAPR